MKGIIFLALRDFVEEKVGFHAWDACLDEVQPASEGIYVSPVNYPDDELYALVGQLSKQLQTPVSELVRAFGEFLLPVLVNAYPDRSICDDGPQAFLARVGSVIHEEVHKLWPDSRPACIELLHSEPGCLQLAYHSDRRLCHLAEGLIAGTATLFNTRIDQCQSSCMHRGDDHCIFELTFHDG